VAMENEKPISEQDRDAAARSGQRAAEKAHAGREKPAGGNPDDAWGRFAHQQSRKDLQGN